MNNKIRVLILEDVPADAELVTRELRRAGVLFVSKRVDTKNAFARELEDFKPDIVLADYKLPAFDGRSAVQLVRQTHPEVPVIMVTGTLGDEAAVGLLKAGAKDYVLKDGLKRLGPAVRRALSEEQGIHARKQAERAVKDSEKRFRSLIEHASDLVTVVDAQGKIAYISPSVKRLGGYEADEVLGTLHLDYAHPEDRSAAAAGFVEVLRDPSKLHVLEFRFRAKDGTWVTLESIARSALDDPAINGIVINSRDISERKRAEAAIAASETRYRRLFEAARDGILIADVQSGQIVDVNPFMIELLGYTREQYLGKKLWEIGPFKDTAATKTAFAELQKNRYVHYENLPLRTADGRDINVEFVSHVYRVDGGEVIQCNIRDITERKRAEDALAESEGKLKAIFDAAADGIVLADTGTRRFGAANASFCRMLGYSLDEVLGLGVADIHPGEAMPYVMRQFELQAKAEFGVIHDVPVRRKDGSIFFADINSTPLTLGGSSRLLGIFRDVTERRRAEEELKRLNWALRALSQGNSALVHAGGEQELFQSCCEAIVSEANYPLAWIGVARDDPGRTIEIAATAGEAIGFMTGLNVSWGDGPLGRGPCGSAIKTGATQINNDLATNPAYAPWLEQARASGLTSAISLPIRSDGAVAAVLTVYGREPNAFGKDEVELFDQLAGDIGYGVSNRRTRLAYDEGILQRQRDAERLHAVLQSAIAALAATVEQRDPYTAGHQRRVAELAIAIGRELSLDEQRLEGLRIASIIHDIGKISVPAEILSRPGKLGEAEFEIVKGHAQAGYEIVKGVDFPWPVAQAIRQHHERLDGSGYPQGLKGEQIILEARIIAVADVIEAMSSHRPYRPGLGIEKALAEIERGRGSAYDPSVVDACAKLFREKRFSWA